MGPAFDEEWGAARAEATERVTAGAADPAARAAGSGPPPSP